MNEIVVLVEGRTEKAFVQAQLQPYFQQLGFQMWPRLHGLHGGVRRWPAIKKDIMRSLKERRDRLFTTMFDFFAMPPDWPGRVDAAGRPWRERAAFVERAMLADIVQNAGPDFNPARFIPYIQLHEFEALLFCDVNVLALTISSQESQRAKKLAQRLQEDTSNFSSPEQINDGWETAPSKRIARLAPDYNKTLHGPTIAGIIGLQKLREKCANFNRWIERLETAVRQFHGT